MIEGLVNQLQGYFGLLRRLVNNNYHFTSRLINSHGGLEESLVNFYKSIGLNKIVVNKLYIKSHIDLEKYIEELFVQKLDTSTLSIAKIIAWDIIEYIDLIAARDIKACSMTLFELENEKGEGDSCLIMIKDNQLVLISVSQA